MSGSIGADEPPLTRVEIPAGQGVQAGDHNTQHNEYNIENYIQNLIQPPVPVPGQVLVGGVPQSPPAFQPRTDLLAALSTTGPGVSVVRAVTGLRGVGKTQVAAAYARSCINEGWRLVAWINAEDASGIVAGLAVVAAGLGLGAGGGDAEALGWAVRHELETDGDRCLLVFDNATDPELLQPFLPVAGAARVIITSNQQSMANLGATVPVDVFSPQEALAFLAERTGSADVEGARALAAELGYLPLALAQATAVVAGQHLDYGTYLDRLRAMPVAELLMPVEAGQYPRGLAAAVLLSLDSVRAGDDTGVCTAVMELLAVLSPAGVRRAFVHAAGHEGVLNRDGQVRELPPVVVDRALARLAGASLLTFSVDGSILSVHRLVMRVIREQLSARNSLIAVCTTIAQLLEQSAESLNVNLTRQPDRAAIRDMVEQIMALYESSAGCPVNTSLVHRTIHLRARAVFLLNQLGDNPAQPILIAKPLLADQERTLGADHPETVKTRGNLANAYRSAGRAAEAITLHEQNLPVFERTLGADHPETVKTRGNLALAYREAGRIADAIILGEQTLADRERVLGADHPDTLVSRNNLASAYVEAGRIADAIVLDEQTLADRERVLGADHPYTLGSRSNLASSYVEAGRIADAIVLDEQTLADQERVLGADHPDTLSTRNNLGISYARTGRIAEAVRLLEQTLADRERVLGADHPGTLSTRGNLALAYREAGRIAEAVRLLEQTLADQERVLGADHPATVKTRGNLADAYRSDM